MKTSKSILLFILFGLISGFSEQRASAYQYDSSIVIGPTFSSYSFDSASTAVLGSTSTGVGYSFGSMLGIGIDQQFGGEFGIFFTKRKTTFPSNISYSITNINVPVLLRWTPLSTFLGLKVEAGPYFGFFPTSSIVQNSITVASSSDSDSVDVGGMAGLTLLLPINDALQFRVSAFYSYGFSDLSSGTADITTRGLDTYIGVMILR